MNMIGRYQVESRIGAGSFATVWRAHDPALDVTVAIKLLAENWAANPDVRARFLGEARMLRRFSDQRIVRVHDIGTTEKDQPFFVMDLADAGSLEKLRRQLVPPGRALRLCAEAARGLEVLHRSNVIHRDMTPGNVLMQYSTQGLRVMLTDLGVAKSLTDRQEGTMTAGTPAYMAYEQATGGRLDERVDIYSMAAVTYALLTGHPPFPIKTLNDLLVRDWSVGVTPISDAIGAPPALDTLFMAALSPNPHDRPQSAYELAQALDSFANVLPGGETYTPIPMDPPQGLMPAPTADRPVAPLPLTDVGWSDPSYRSEIGSDTSWTSSLGGWNQPAASVTPIDQTPEDMLANYLGESTYEPAKVKESHPLSYWVTLGIVILVVVSLTMWATVSFLR